MATPRDRLPGFMVIPKLIKRKVPRATRLNHPLPPTPLHTSTTPSCHLTKVVEFEVCACACVCNIGRQRSFLSSFCIYKRGCSVGRTSSLGVKYNNGSLASFVSDKSILEGRVFVIYARCVFNETRRVLKSKRTVQV